MKKRISLLLPTRGRPRLVERFLESVVAHSAHPELVEVVVCVDEDDVDSHRIVSNELALKLLVVPRQTMGGYNATCLRHASGQITIAVNDDVVIRTKGWDDMVRALDARYPDGVYLGYANDLFKGSKLCTFPILSLETCQQLAEPYPAVYKGAFIDVHLMDIFWRLKARGQNRIAFAEDIVFEHLHYRRYPALLDQTYRERSRFGDDLTFIALVETRRREADRLLARIAERPLDVLPQLSESLSKPTGLFGMLRLCSTKFLFDTDLPLRWRTYLFIWMLGRHYFNLLQKSP